MMMLEFVTKIDPSTMKNEPFVEKLMQHAVDCLCEMMLAEVNEWKMTDDWMDNVDAWKMKADLPDENQERNEVKNALV